jgi:hypothetical protein
MDLRASRDSIARRYEDMTIASLRFHWVVEDFALAQARASHNFDMNAKQLWAYTLAESARGLVWRFSTHSISAMKPFILCHPPQ